MAAVSGEGRPCRVRIGPDRLRQATALGAFNAPDVLADVACDAERSRSL
jgi:hypothetical protein